MFFISVQLGLNACEVIRIYEIVGYQRAYKKFAVLVSTKSHNNSAVSLWFIASITLLQHNCTLFLGIPTSWSLFDLDQLTQNTLGIWAAALPISPDSRNFAWRQIVRSSPWTAVSLSLRELYPIFYRRGRHHFSVSPERRTQHVKPWWRPVSFISLINQVCCNKSSTDCRPSPRRGRTTCFHVTHVAHYWELQITF